MSQAVFALQEAPLKPFVTEAGSPAPLSAPAAALRRWAGVACRLGILTAVVPLIVAVAYVVLVAEPLWQRLMTLVVVGLAPAVMVLVTGLLLGGTLSLGSRLADPVAALAWRLTAPLRRAARTGGVHCVGFATTTMPRASRRLIGWAIVGWRAWEDLCWTVYRGAHASVLACRRGSRFAARCATRSIPPIRRSVALTVWTIGRCGRAVCVGAVSGFQATVGALDALGCTINATGRMLLIAATFPIRLVARILLRFSASSA
jgi:hypothetical protein